MAGSGTCGVKEPRSQVSQDPGSQSLAHLPLVAVTKYETSAVSRSDQSPASLPESPTVKRGDYPFRRGEFVLRVFV